MVYGDGAFKDPMGKIWELADPVVSPGFTSGLVGLPNELKLKYLADNDFAGLSGDKLKAAIRSRRKRKSLPIAALTAPVDEEQDGTVENATEPECSDEPSPDAASEREPGADVEPEDAPAIEPDEVEDGEYAGMDKSFRIEPSDAYRPRRDDGADDDGEYPGIRF